MRQADRHIETTGGVIMIALVIKVICIIWRLMLRHIKNNRMDSFLLWQFKSSLFKQTLIYIVLKNITVTVTTAIILAIILRIYSAAFEVLWDPTNKTAFALYAYAGVGPVPTGDALFPKAMYEMNA